MSRPGHLGRIVFGYTLSCFVTAVLGYTIVRYGAPGAARAWLFTFGSGSVSVVSATFTLMTTAALPAAFILLFAEYFQVRSLRFYIGIGAVASLCVVWVFTGFQDWGGPWFYALAFTMTTLAFIGGAYAYWSVAGRRAGWSGT